MDYEKHVWVVGEVITAEKLNHMEDGIAGLHGQTDEQETPSPSNEYPA